MELFDMNMRAGQSALGTYKPAVSADDLTAEMDRLGVRKALVWHIAQYEYSAAEGNRMLEDVIGGSGRLIGSWALLPPQTGEQEPPDKFFASMKKQGIRGLRVFPDEHRFFLNRVVFGKFLDEVCERKIPVFFSVGNKAITWRGIYEVLADYPGLVCVICDTGIWGSDRYFRPLLEHYENVYIETSLISLGEGVMESLVRRYGSDRLVFGSGFPKRMPEAAILQLTHADISEREKEAIAWGNGERLISEVKV